MPSWRRTGTSGWPFLAERPETMLEQWVSGAVRTPIGRFRRNGLEEPPTATIAFLRSGQNPKLESIGWVAVSPETAWRASRDARLLRL